MSEYYDFTKIRQWASDRNLIEGSTPQKQFIKLIEEIGELADGLSRNNMDNMIDAIGDSIVVLTIMAAQLGLNVETCIASAYEEIKDRKGRMINGMFVKEADLKP